MLKIKNATAIVGMKANGCEIRMVEYNNEKRGYFFKLIDEHMLNTTNSGDVGGGYFQIRLLETSNEDVYRLFVMGWACATEIDITKSQMKSAADLTSVMYRSIQMAIESKNEYDKLR